MDGAIQSGTILGGRYRLGERLGHGGWGSVYAAVQIDLGRPVAIKVLHESVALAADGLVRFEREAKAAAALGHPNIAQVSDFQANPGEPPFLVMELLTGSTLGAKMRATPKMAPARMAWIAYQMLAGLDVAHKAGIVHRDIKPDNVFLVSMPGVEDYVKLLDFGIAKLSGDTNQHLTTTGTMLGSPAFMAPEQVRTNQLDHRVDLYAVGATLYLALAGRMPYEATNIHALLLAITEQRPVPLHVVDPAIDVALSNLVERAMCKDPAGRFATAEEMRGALEPWLGGMAAHASSTASASRVVSPASTATAPIPVTAAPSGPPLGTPPPGMGPGTPQVGSVQNPSYGLAPNPNYGGPAMNASYGAPAPNPNYGAAAPTNPPYGAAAPNPSYGAAAPTNPPYGAPTPQFAAHAQSQALAPAAIGAASGQPAKGSSGAVIGLLVVVVLLLLVGVGVGIMAYVSNRNTTTAAAAVPSGAGAGPGAQPASSLAANGAPAAAASGAGAVGTPAAAAGARKPGVTGAAVAASPAGAVVTPVPGAAPGAPAAVAIVADAGAGAGGGAGGAAKKQFAGTSFRIGSGAFEKFDIDASKAAIMAKSGAIGACYQQTEFDPPDHQFTDWTFQVDPAGNVKSVGRTTSFEPHPKFDACMVGALRQVKWPASATGGSPHVGFTARTRDNP